MTFLPLRRRDALDFVRMAKFLLAAPSFRPARTMWFSEIVVTLHDVISDLEREAETIPPPLPTGNAT